jgi:KDO2-lipid IV(A) lauroyltransferase
MPLHTVRGDDGKYYSEFGDEVVMKLTGDRLTDLTDLSQQFHNIFEQWLREYPEQGFWLQRKWRRKPSRRRARGQNPGHEASRTTPREARP